MKEGRKEGRNDKKGVEKKPVAAGPTSGGR